MMAKSHSRSLTDRPRSSPSSVLIFHLQLFMLGFQADLNAYKVWLVFLNFISELYAKPFHLEYLFFQTSPAVRQNFNPKPSFVHRATRRARKNGRKYSEVI
jgi:hypothetical protein